TEGETNIIFPLPPISTKRQIAGTIKIVTQWFADEIGMRKRRNPLPQIKVFYTRQDCLIEKAAIEEQLSMAGHCGRRKERSIIDLRRQSLVWIVPLRVINHV